MRNGLIAFALAAGLSGCSLLPGGQKAPPLGNVTPLGTGLDLTLPATPNYPGAFSASQVVSAQYQDQRVTFQAVLELSPDKADIVLTAPAGPRILGIHWTRAGITEDRTLLAPSQLNALNVLGDIFISQWPLAEVRKAVPPGVDVLDVGTTRQVIGNGHVIVDIKTIRTEDGVTRQTLTQNDFGYRMVITTEAAVSGGAD